MKIKCAICSKRFEAQRSTAKYCGPRCRQVAARRRGAAKQPAPPVDDIDLDEGDDDTQYQSRLVRTIRAELERLKAIDTVDGQLAIELALKITTPGMTGVAGLSKELRSVRNQIRMAAAPPAPSGPAPKDMVAEARKKREQKTRQATTRRA